jgi:hypothetical protein
MAIYASAVSTIITVGILIRPIFRQRSFDTTGEGIASGVVGTFDILGLVVAFSSGQLPTPFCACQ